MRFHIVENIKGVKMIKEYFAILVPVAYNQSPVTRSSISWKPRNKRNMAVDVM
jgi:hypothetical protein